MHSLESIIASLFESLGEAIDKLHRSLVRQTEKLDKSQGDSTALMSTMDSILTSEESMFASFTLLSILVGTRDAIGKSRHKSALALNVCLAFLDAVRLKAGASQAELLGYIESMRNDLLLITSILAS